MNFYGRELSVFKASLHNHTTTSDGKKTPQELIALYADAGYDVMVLTDHMKTNNIAALDPHGMNIISGIELFANGPREITWHVLAIGVPEDFPGEKYDVQEAIDKIKGCGGLAFCAHPFWSGLTSAEILKYHGFSGTEVTNTSCRYIGRESSEECWSELIEAGMVMGALAVDDIHGMAEFNRNWTMIAAEKNTPEAIKDALKKGQYYSTQGPEFYSLSLKDGFFEAEFSEAEEVIVTGKLASGDCFACPGYPTPENEFGIVTSLRAEITPRYKGVIRCRIKDTAGRYAWTNPIEV